MEDHNHLVKIDSNYNVIYSKTFGFPLTTNSYSRIAGLTRVTNNRLAMCSQAKLNNNLVSNITFVNSSNGNIIWSKTIDSIAAMNVKYKNNKISIFGYLNNYSYLINLDTNGNLISTKKINLDYNNPLPGPPSIYSYSLSAGDIGKDSSFFLLSSTPSYTNCGFKVTKLDKNENLVWSYEYKTNQNNDLYNNTILATQDGGVLVHFLHIGILYKINKFGKLMWQNYLGTIDRQLLFEKPDGQIFTYSEDGHLKLFDQNGNCLLYKLTYCVPKQQRRITAFFSNSFYFYYGCIQYSAYLSML